MLFIEKKKLKKSKYSIITDTEYVVTVHVVQQVVTKC